MRVWWEGNTFLQYPHSIMDRFPLGPGILLIFGHSQREFKAIELSEFFWDIVDIVGMVEVDGEDIVISFGGAWLESLTVEFDEVFFFWITVDVVGVLIDVALKAGLRLLFTAPPQVAVFYVGADDVQISVPTNVLRGGHRQPFFEKNLLTFLRGKGGVGHPYFFMRSIWSKNEKNEIFPRSEGNKGGRGESMHFLHSRCISFGVRINFSI